MVVIVMGASVLGLGVVLVSTVHWHLERVLLGRRGMLLIDFGLVVVDGVFAGQAVKVMVTHSLETMRGWEKRVTKVYKDSVAMTSVVWWSGVERGEWSRVAGG